jgi:GNAT superfamily N-acetyltransferase
VLRPPTEQDLDEVVRLMSLDWPEPVDPESVRLEWSDPRADVASDARIEPGAYAMIENLGSGRAWMSLHGAPSRDLLDWAERRAGELGERILSGAWFENDALLHELERRGFRLVRHSHRMEIDLDRATGEPRWPEGVAVRAFEPGDERTFWELEQETFADTWEPESETYEEWAHWMLEPPTFTPALWFLAHEDGEPAGIAVCHPRSGREGVGWVRILGVRRPWRRRGLGRALLLHSLSELRLRGFSRAGLGVDAESLTGAHCLYESVGMHVAGRFDIYEKAAA